MKKLKNYCNVLSQFDQFVSKNGSSSHFYVFLKLEMNCTNTQIRKYKAVNRTILSWRETKGDTTFVQRPDTSALPWMTNDSRRA